MSVTQTQPLATAADLMALDDAIAAEVVCGRIVEKALATIDHSGSQTGIAAELGSRYGRPPGGERPGGWWIRTVAEVQYESHEVYRHDLAGWRRERLPDRPTGRPMLIRPDWVCEVLSPSNWSNDTVVKLKTLYRNGVPYYWIADVEHQVLTAFRWTENGYAIAVTALAGERHHIPPFDAVELDVGVLLGGDPPADG